MERVWNIAFSPKTLQNILNSLCSYLTWVKLFRALIYFLGIYIPALPFLLVNTLLKDDECIPHTLAPLTASSGSFCDSCSFLMCLSSFSPFLKMHMLDIPEVCVDLNWVELKGRILVWLLKGCWMRVLDCCCSVAKSRTTLCDPMAGRCQAPQSSTIS